MPHGSDPLSRGGLRTWITAADSTAARHAVPALVALGSAIFIALAASLPLQPELHPDTESYLALFPTRPPAYGLLLNGWAWFTGGLAGLPQLQAAALVAATTALAIAAAQRLRSLVLGVGIVFAVLLPSDLRYWPSVAMSEALFAAAIMAMLAAGLRVDPECPARGLWQVGGWAAAAIALRNAGLPLTIAAALLAFAVARTERHPARSLLAATVLPAVLVLVANVAVHLAWNGRMTVGSWSGVSLAGKGLMLTRPGDEVWLPPPLQAAPRLAAEARTLPPDMPLRLRMRVRHAQYDAIRFHHLWPELARAGIVDYLEINAMVGPAAWRAVRQDLAGYAALAVGDWAALWLVPEKITPTEREVELAFALAHPPPLLDMERPGVMGMLVPPAERPVAVWLRRIGALVAFVAGIAAVAVAVSRTWRRRPLGLAGPAAFASLALNGSFIAIAAMEGGLGRYAMPLWPAQVVLCAVSLAWLAARIAVPPPLPDQRVLRG